MRRKKLSVTCLLVLCVSVLCGFASAKSDAEDGQWISLFNGKNLDGWKVKITGYELGDNFGDTFRVEDGVMKVCYDKYDKFDGKFGHIFYEEKFSHYILHLEYRFVGGQTPGGPGWAFRNSGIMMHCQKPESMGKNQKFPVSVEVQLLGGGGKNKRSTGNTCTPGTHIVMNDQLVTRHCINSKSKTYHGDQWVTMDLEVHGNDLVRHIINGEVVMEYEMPQLDEKDADAKKVIAAGADMMLSEGYISLQAESHPVEFRNIKIKPLDNAGISDKIELSDMEFFSADPDVKKQDVWSMENGLLVCKGNPLGYLYSKKDYRDLNLKLEWRWPEGKPGKGGVLIRMTGDHKVWPKSLEAQINAGDAGDFWGLDGYKLTGPADRSRSLEHQQFGKLTNVRKSKAVEKPAGQWNTYEINAEGDTVTLIINGEEVNKATRCDLDAGRICLTSEGSEIHFRNISLTVPVE